MALLDSNTSTCTLCRALVVYCMHLPKVPSTYNLTLDCGTILLTTAVALCLHSQMSCDDWGNLCLPTWNMILHKLNLSIATQFLSLVAQFVAICLKATTAQRGRMQITNWNQSPCHRSGVERRGKRVDVWITTCAFRVSIVRLSRPCPHRRTDGGRHPTLPLHGTTQAILCLPPAHYFMFTMQDQASGFVSSSHPPLPGCCTCSVALADTAQHVFLCLSCLLGMNGFHGASTTNFRKGRMARRRSRGTV